MLFSCHYLPFRSSVTKVDTVEGLDNISDAFRRMIESIYNSGNVPDLETNEYMDLLEVANFYLLRDVIDECNKHGGVMHIYVDKASPQGNVYVKCPNIGTAVAAVNALHGRWFAGENN